MYIVVTLRAGASTTPARSPSTRVGRDGPREFRNLERSFVPATSASLVITSSLRDTMGEKNQFINVVRKDYFQCARRAGHFESLRLVRHPWEAIVWTAVDAPLGPLGERPSPPPPPPPPVRANGPTGGDPTRRSARVYSNKIRCVVNIAQLTPVYSGRPSQ